MKATDEHPYPLTFEEFLDWFPTEDDCVQYLEWIRWGTGFVCPNCGSNAAWKIHRNNLWHCKKCGRQSSVRSGTVFDDGRKPLKLWFYVMWLLMAQKTGISAKNFHDAFGFGSYQTSWGWLQKLRSVMIRPGREPLSGRIELDETFIGGQKEGARGRGAEGKTLVLVAIEGEKGKKLGRVRFRIIPNAKSDTIRPFVRDYIKEGATIVTDGLKSYDMLDGIGYRHEKHIQSSKTDHNPLISRLEHVHLVISLLKRWLNGTHQGGVTPNHLAGYLDEFAFRFNRRTSSHRGKLFYRLIQQSILSRPDSIKGFYVSKKEP